MVQGKGKFEELMVCSHEIAASTAQLVAASKVGPVGAGGSAHCEAGWVREAPKKNFKQGPARRHSQEKVLATKADDVSSIPGTSVVE